MTTTMEPDYLTEETRDDFDEVDQEALDRALNTSLTGKEREHAEHVRDILADNWFIAASQAAYHQQIRHLRLRSSEDPPMFVDADEIDNILSQPDHRQFAAAKLLKRMLAAGVSIFDPTPLDSITARKPKPRKK